MGAHYTGESAYRGKAATRLPFKENHPNDANTLEFVLPVGK